MSKIEYWNPDYYHVAIVYLSAEIRGKKIQ